MRSSVLAFATDLLDEGGDTLLAVVLRPVGVDCDGPADLAAKVAVLRELGAPEVECYDYGLMRLSSLDRIGAALRS
ncbi:hypothetical protein [Kitasatospora acidiphila]|uniref:hypothetical protein n=1 Tax=Kitasatospora acidiphila TaxID=2567942 RepID=UPI003C75820B